MSMLAERKVKQKWSLNPRGKAWSSDSNKFGQKMLEKMGWSDGKGLGAHENGITEHIKVAVKNDSKGMGFKESTEQWKEHDSQFNELLQSLSGGQETVGETKISSSLEEKSQNTKSRVHYKKFTRGKDLSRCSAKDLANIFGKKSLDAVKQKHDNDENTKDDIDNVINGGSMLDYFKKKLPNFGKNGFVVGSNGVLKKASDDEESAYVGFGFQSGMKRSVEDETIDETPKKKIKLEIEDKESKTEKKKKKKHSSNSENDTSVIDDISENVNKKKKKKQNQLDNPSFDIDTPVTDYVNENFEVKRKKKKQLKTEDNPNFDLNDTNDSFVNTNFEVKRKKPKSPKVDEVKQKKVKKAKLETEEALDNPTFDESDNKPTFVNETCEVKRKKSKKSASITEENGEASRKNPKSIDNPIFDASDNKPSFVDETFEVKRKKPKKSANVIEESPMNGEASRKNPKSIDNPIFDASDNKPSFVDETFEVKRKKPKKSANVIEESPMNGEVKRKKSKKSSSVAEESPMNGEASRKKPKSVDNPIFDASDNKPSFVDETFEVKRKKPKKLPNFDENAFVNDTFEVKRKKTEIPPTNDEPTCDLLLNVTTKPAVLTPKSPKITSKAKRRKSVRFSDVNQERIIPSNDELNERNQLLRINAKVIAANNINEMSRKLDGLEAEIENDMNEAKQSNYVGEMGTPDGENEKIEGGTRLKFKYANFGRAGNFKAAKAASSTKACYKHLIKGDIVLKFNNTNLHEVRGYAVKIKNV